MDDLGEVQEEYVDKYEFIVVRPQRTLDKAVKLPANHRNLLACSALHGKLYSGIGPNIRICSVSDLRDVPKKPSESNARYESSAPITTVDLSQHDVADVLHVGLLLADTILAVLATSASNSSETVLLFLHVTALCNGDVMLRSAPALTGITAIAVCPYDVNTEHETSALLMCLTDDQSVYVHRISETKAENLLKIGGLGALSLAISQRSDTSHDVLAAIGTSRGNVVLLNPLNGQQVGTIVEVESGWLPIQVHFAGAGYLFTTYQRDNNTKNVMWHLQRKSVTSVSTDGHSPLGELCYQLFFQETKQDTSLAPSMMFSFIPEWNLAVVSSSVSSDIAIIAKSDDDGVWVNYKLDDSKEAVMPVVVGEDGDKDCVPIGMAFDLNNTSTIPAPDPDDPDINPMPTLVILSNTGVLLSFRLVDDHAKATCSIVRDVGPLPPLPAPIAEISPTVTKLSNMRVSPNSHPKQPRLIKQSTLTTQKLFSSVTVDSKSPAAALPSSASNSGAQLGPPSFGLSPSTTSCFATGDPFKYPASSKPPPSVHMNVSAEDNATSFSSKFNFSTPPRSPSMFSVGRGHSSSKPPAPPTHRRPNTLKPQTSPKIFSQSPKPSALPTQQKLPPVHLESKLDDSLNALQDASSGDSLGAISSILHEMAEELRTTYNASRAINEQLAILKPSISSSIEKVSKEVNVRLNELARGFETEKKLRQGATECMTMILKLHRDYETICMEDSAQREDSISNQLREKYRVAEERMSQKEAEIEKGVAYVTNKVEPSEFEQKARKDPAETMQMIYSCISLQGLRIKRLLTLLNSLFERAELDNQNGRRSDLGLSLARLEKLSLGPSTNGLPGKDSVSRKNMHSRHSLDPKNNSISPKFDKTKDEPSSVSNEVRDVLRRLAMRGGRANITVDTSVVTRRTLETEPSSTRRRPASTVLTSSGISLATNAVISDSKATSSQTSTPIQSKPRPFSITTQTQPPPPPPHTQREQTIPFTTRSQRQSTEPLKPGTTKLFKQESPFSLFGSQTQPPVFPGFQRTSTIPKRESPISAATIPKRENPISAATIPKKESLVSAATFPKQESPISTAPISHSAKRSAPSNESPLSTPSRASDRPKSDSPSSHSAAEESLPTIDITSSPASAKKHQWDHIPVASIVRTPPVTSFRPSPSAESISSKPSPEKRSSENGDWSTLETANKPSQPKSEKIDRKSSQGSLFAALPPDDSLTTPLQQKKPLTGTGAVPVFGNAASAPSFSISSSFAKSPSKPGTAQSTPDSPLQTAKMSSDTEAPSSTTLGLFGSQLSLGGDDNESHTEKGAAVNSTSLFGVPLTNNSSQASTSGGTSSFASFGAFTSPSNASGTSQSSANTTAVSPFGALSSASSASASTTTVPTSIGSSTASSATMASVSPFGMVSPTSDASSGSFGATGATPFRAFGGGGGFNTSTAGAQSFGGMTAGNGGGNASLFQAAASKMTEPSSKVAESIGTVDRMGHGDGSSSEDDSDGEGLGLQRRQGMETTPSGFGESTPQTQEQRPTNLFGTPSNGGSGGGAALFGGGGSVANALFGAGGNTAFSTPPGSNGLGGMGSSFGMTSSFGGGGFGGSAAFGSTSTFGSATQQQSSFGAPSPIGANAIGFGGMTAKFGESTFGGAASPVGQQQQQSPAQAAAFRTPVSTTFGGANAGQSPFGAVGSDSGASPFAAASSGGGSAFGSFGQSGMSGADGSGAAGGGLMFGSGKPPAFTASSFYERRA